MQEIPPEFERYQRQIALENFGIKSQKKLQNSSIAIIGAGGVGSAALPLLAGSGIGKIKIIDCDKVSLTNLHRQTIYSESETDKPKTDAAKERLSKLNSSIEIEAFNVKISDADTLKEILKNTDICIDATDSFNTRFIVSDACKSLQIPEIYASAQGYVSQNILFCKNFYLREFLEEENSAQRKPQNLPIFPPAAHLSGIWAAATAIKYLAGIEDIKAGFFKSYNFSDDKFTRLEF